LLAACGQTGQTTAGNHTAQYGGYNRPSSYDPPGPPGDPWGPWIREASHRFDVPERWIREVMRQESGGRTNATSPVGAMGLMQVMPGTYRQLAGRYGFGADPYHPYDSIMAGAAYIREMYDLYGSPAFLAAYNAGPRRLEDYLWNSKGLPNETRNYVARIGPNIVDHHPKHRAPPEVYAAAEIPLNIPRGPRRMDGSTMLALREQRQGVQPGIQVAQLQGRVFRLMEPVDSASERRSQTQLASADPASIPGTVVRMDPIPNPPEPAARSSLAAPEVVRMDPIPNPPERLPEPRAEVTRMDPIPNPPEAAEPCADTVMPATFVPGSLFTTTITTPPSARVLP
jgi:hypothetical protein